VACLPESHGVSVLLDYLLPFTILGLTYVLRLWLNARSESQKSQTRVSIFLFLIVVSAVSVFFLPLLDRQLGSILVLAGAHVAAKLGLVRFNEKLRTTVASPRCRAGVVFAAVRKVSLWNGEHRFCHSGSAQLPQLRAGRFSARCRKRSVWAFQGHWLADCWVSLGLAKFSRSALLLAASAAVLTIAFARLPEVLVVVFATPRRVALPPVQSAARTTYPSLIAAEKHTLIFGLDATLQGVVWIVGPVVATLLASAIAPEAGMVAIAVILVSGVLWFLSNARSRSNQVEKPNGKARQSFEKQTSHLECHDGFFAREDPSQVLKSA
jgi:hypothetical protein